MPLDRGNVQLVGKLFYCLEHPLLIDGTIQENILFGLPYDEAMYKRALYCSCLDDKLDQWRLRDLTRVGRAKGGMGFSPIAGEMTLDGRHRKAIALARAIYADADVYLFDNIFQALGDDSEKAWHRCVTKQLCKATVICTFNDPGAAVPMLKACDRILLLERGASKIPPRVAAWSPRSLTWALTLNSISVVSTLLASFALPISSALRLAPFSALQNPSHSGTLVADDTDDAAHA